MKRKILVFLLIVVFGTGQAMVFAESGGEESPESTEYTEDEKSEAAIENTENAEIVSKKPETGMEPEKKEPQFEEEKIGGGDSIFQ